MGGVEPGKSSSNENRASIEAPRRFSSSRLPQNASKMVPWKTQNRSEIGLQVIKLDKSSCNHNYGSISKRLGHFPQLWDSKNNKLYKVL